ncbi:MAG: biotin--[acetyl-CoA-carboxylase] ligase [Gammaproteobacteria bacterium]|nr:biotin--[acetyl-CoA-carboxylase] ligase [Gammaproteobacteria bacterium]
MFGDRLIRRLADGSWQRVEDAERCRSALSAVGLGLECNDEGCCRLPHTIDLFDHDAIVSALAPQKQVNVEVVGSVDSTNTQLLQRPAPAVGTTEVLLAEFQNAGRGRHGRTWLAPYGGGVCLSAAWQFRPQPSEPGTLSLAVGVAVIRALAEIGVKDAKLKWPNDVHRHGQKLGGVLIDAQRQDDGLHIVAGIGLNVRLSQPTDAAIAADGGVQPADLFRIDPSLAARRNELAAALIEHIMQMQREFGQKGFDPFREEWNDADVLAGCTVRISGSSTLAGEAIGIDESGALMVRAGKMTHRLLSGDVRVRAS